MLKINLLGIVLLINLILAAQQKNIFTTTSVPYPELKSGFANPPAEARGHHASSQTFWEPGDGADYRWNR